MMIFGFYPYFARMPNEGNLHDLTYRLIKWELPRMRAAHQNPKMRAMCRHQDRNRALHLPFRARDSLRRR